MDALIEQHRDHIAEVCREFRVRRLEVFGSAARGDFDPARSDVDVVAEFDGSETTRSFGHYLAFKSRLEELLGHPVDVVEMSALKNPRLRFHIERSKVPVYEAA